MVPFSFPQPLLKSRVMKERSLLSSPLTGAKQAALPIFFISPNRVLFFLFITAHGGVQRHAGLVGRRCRAAPIKNPPCLPILPSKNPHEPNPFPGTQPAPGVLHFYPWFPKNM